MTNVNDILKELQNNQIKIKINKNGAKYFNPQHIRDALKELGYDTHNMMCAVDAERNIGKSYGAFDDLHNDYLKKSDFKNKYAYVRTNLAKTKLFRSTFNDKFKQDGYYCGEKGIYYFGDDEINPRKVNQYPMVATVLTIDNEMNYKSGWFQDTHRVIWDEYNEIASNGKMFQNFTNLMKTVKRETDGFEIWLMGNKNDGDNDILVALQVDTPIDNESSWLQVIKPGVYYISIGISEYDQIKANDPDDLISLIASCDPTTDEFINHGGFLKKRDSDIMLWKNMQALGFESKRYFTFQQDSYILGELIDGSLAIIQTSNFDGKFPIIALDNLATLYKTDSVSLLTKEQYKRLAQYFKAKVKTNRLFYANYYTKAQWTIFIMGLTQLTIQ